VDPEQVRFGLIGGSAIAERAVLPALAAVPGAQAVLLASRSEARRSELAARFGLRTSPDYAAVLADPEVEAVYISLPNALHERWSLRALAAGKHVYCEKPAVLEAAGAARVAALARQRRRVFLEGFMFLFHPQHQRVKRLIQEGVIGQPLHLDAWFGIPPLEPGNIRLDPALGGGALNDAGGYPLHAARLLFGAEPSALAGRLFRCPGGGVDERGVAWLEFPAGRTAHLAFGFGLGYRNAYAVWGTEGLLQLERAFSVSPEHAPTIALRDRAGREALRRLPPANHFELTVAAFVAAVRGALPFDAFLDDFEALASLLDRLRQTAEWRG
jgi:predicted dehydrogenase